MDVQFLQFTVHKVIQSSGHTVMLLFAFEYLIQISAISSSIVKYTFSAVDSLLEGRWESRGVYVFYLELLTDLVHLCVYLIFFGIVLMQYGLPIHLVRLCHAHLLSLDCRFVICTGPFATLEIVCVIS